MFRAGDRRVRLGWAELVAGLVIGLCPSPAGAWRQVVDYAYEATAVAVDGAGDVIAGGYEMINKYARSTGAQLWHRDMSARAMTVDGSPARRATWIP